MPAAKGGAAVGAAATTAANSMASVTKGSIKRKEDDPSRSGKTPPSPVLTTEVDLIDSLDSSGSLSQSRRYEGGAEGSVEETACRDADG